MERPSTSSRLCLLVAALLAASPLAAAEPLRFEQAASARRPHPREIEVEQLLAEVASAAVGRGGILLEGPTTSLTTGPRRAEGSTDADAMVEVEVPLLAARQRRGDLAEALDAKADAVRVSARGIALADLSAAYARVWLAQTEAKLREEDIAVVDDWLAATQRRVEAGADPPYESILIAGERDRATLDLLAARREVELAWGELARLSAIAESSQPVDLATLPGASDGDATLEGSGETALAGIEARRELIALLARARSGAASSRWALAGDAGREGDERLARVGFAYRFPLGGERASIAELERTAEAGAAGDAAADRGELRARLAAARTALASTGPGLAAGDYEAARRALDARIAEGKQRASEVLPLRRQLLEAALTRAQAEASRAQASAELHFLDGGNLP